MNAEQARILTKLARDKRVEETLCKAQSEIKEAITKGRFNTKFVIEFDVVKLSEENYLEIREAIKDQDFELISSFKNNYLTLDISWGEDGA